MKDKENTTVTLELDGITDNDLSEAERTLRAMGEYFPVGVPVHEISRYHRGEAAGRSSR